jgi:hypothetical protein
VSDLEQRARAWVEANYSIKEIFQGEICPEEIQRAASAAYLAGARDENSACGWIIDDVDSHLDDAEQREWIKATIRARLEKESK